MSTLECIVSGGQTGVDRAALDAALSEGVPCGGWCPKGRLAEDGTIPDRYPLKVFPGAGYLQRTRRNVEDSDGTLVLTFGAPSGGTLRTVEFCQKLGKPVLVIDAERIAPVDGAEQTRAFVSARGIARLNVAGPRGSREPKAYPYTLALVGVLLGPAKRGS